MFSRKGLRRGLCKRSLSVLLLLLVMLLGSSTALFADESDLEDLDSLDDFSQGFQIVPVPPVFIAPAKSFETEEERKLAETKEKSKVGAECLQHIDCESSYCNSLIQKCESARCGNGVLEGTEGCDDNNTLDGDGCDYECRVEIGTKCYSNAECATGFCKTSTNTCETPVCGNDTVEGQEECDDGNSDDEDGCTSQCKKVERVDRELERRQIEECSGDERCEREVQRREERRRRENRRLLQSCTNQGSDYQCLASRGCSSEGGVCMGGDYDCTTGCCCLVPSAACPVGSSEDPAALDCTDPCNGPFGVIEVNGLNCYECAPDPNPDCSVCQTAPECIVEIVPLQPEVSCSINLSGGGAARIGESVTVSGEVSCSTPSSERENESFLDKLFGIPSAWAFEGTSFNIESPAIPSGDSGVSESCASQALEWSVSGGSTASISTGPSSATVTCNAPGEVTLSAHQTGSCSGVSPSGSVSVTCEGECIGDADCDQGQFCQNYICEDPICLDDAQCETPLYCADDGTCKQRTCSSKSDCPTGQYCSGGSCAVGDCGSASDCELGYLCENNQCIEDPACESDSDCSNGQLCESGLCVDPPEDPCDVATDSITLCMDGGPGGSGWVESESGGSVCVDVASSTCETTCSKRCGSAKVDADGNICGGIGNPEWATKPGTQSCGECEPLCDSGNACANCDISVSVSISGPDTLGAGESGDGSVSVSISGTQGSGESQSVSVSASAGSISPSEVSFNLSPGSVNQSVTLTCPQENESVTVTASYDGSSASFSTECGYCGDSVKAGGEECDQGPSSGGAGCSADCSVETVSVSCTVTASGSNDGKSDIGCSNNGPTTTGMTWEVASSTCNGVSGSSTGPTFNLTAECPFGVQSCSADIHASNSEGSFDSQNVSVDCADFCGNGIVESGEDCDSGAGNVDCATQGGCNTDCTTTNFTGPVDSEVGCSLSGSDMGSKCDNYVLSGGQCTCPGSVSACLCGTLGGTCPSWIVS